MKRRFVILAALAAVAFGCGGGNGKEPAGDVSGDVVAGDTLAGDVADVGKTKEDVVGSDTGKAKPDVVDPEETVCVPDCAGRECGDDGCGGSCGVCEAAGASCNASGLCELVACESSKDCPGDLVCFKDEGVCVVCVIDADCGENQKCEADHTCIDVVLCASDKDCKDFDMVCDKEAGECVDCLSVDDCPEGWKCIDNVCFEPACAPDEVRCNGKDVEICNVDRTGWDLVKSCPENKFCVAGMCLDQVCQPDSLYCEGTEAWQCNSDGSGADLIKDCNDEELSCSAGECTECVPQCENKECGDDGCGGNCGTCPGGLPCVEVKETFVCGTPCDVAKAQGRNAGCEFWAADLDNVEGGQNEKVALFVSSLPGNGDAALTVEKFVDGAPVAMTAQELQVNSLGVPEGGVLTLLMDPSFGLDSAELASKAIRITSSVPVTVHQFNPLNGNNVFTNDASLLLPAHQFDKEYYALSWPMRTGGYKLRGNVAVVATGPGDTFLQITLTSQVLSGNGVPGWTAGGPHEIALKQGQVLNLETEGEQGADLTGSRIVASKPVAVFGAHECGNVPLGTNYCDHLEQQLLPVSGWGNLYAGDAFKPRSANQKDVWRVVAAADDTQVATEPAVGGPWTLNAGEWAEFYAGTSFVLEASAPVLLGHYLQGSNFSGFAPYGGCSGGTGIGDPAFTMAVPLSRFSTYHSVLTPDAYIESYFNIVTPMTPLPEITLDDSVLGSNPIAIGESGYGLYRIQVEPGVHIVTSSGGAVGVTAYGYDCDVSYAYPGSL